MVKILVIGSGAREHAIIKSLNKSKKEKEIYFLASNNNPVISYICKKMKIIDINDAQLIKDYSMRQSIDITIIGPEDPLAFGVADSLWEAGIGVVGPKKTWCFGCWSKQCTCWSTNAYVLNEKPNRWFKTKNHPRISKQIHAFYRKSKNLKENQRILLKTHEF